MPHSNAAQAVLTPGQFRRLALASELIGSLVNEVPPHWFDEASPLEQLTADTLAETKVKLAALRMRHQGDYPGQLELLKTHIAPAKDRRGFVVRWKASRFYWVRHAEYSDRHAMVTAAALTEADAHVFEHWKQAEDVVRFFAGTRIEVEILPV